MNNLPENLPAAIVANSPQGAAWNEVEQSNRGLVAKSAAPLEMQD